MSREGRQRRLSAILAADVAGYTRLVEQDTDGTVAAWKAARDNIIEPAISEHGGRVVKLTGDGFLAEFSSIQDAVTCAIGIQDQLLKSPLDFRIGLHLGDVIDDGKDIHGEGVNVAARIEALAEPGGICISGMVYESVRNRINVTYRDLGPREVKNVSAPVRVYAIGGVERSNSETTTTVDLPVGRGEPSIAVLPFKNLSDDAEQEYFSDGLTEDLITDLSKLSGLFVVARNSSFTFKGESIDPKTAAAKLGVKHVLEGSVRKMGDKIRINVQLIDGMTGGHLWAERYDEVMSEIFTLQDKILEEVLAALAVKLSSRDGQGAYNRPTSNIEAYDLFLRGRTKLAEFSPESMKGARDLFEQAIAIDGSFASAYAYISFIEMVGWAYMWPEFTQDLECALSFAEKAVALDSQSATAQARLAWIKVWLGQLDDALLIFEHAIDLNPKDAENYAYFAEALNYAGQPQRAVEMTRKALEFDPMLPPNCAFHLGHSLYLLGRLEEASEIIRGALERAPAFATAHLVLAAVYSELGQSEMASSEIELARELIPGFSAEYGERVWPYRPREVKERYINSLRRAGLPERG
jgi:adenylate cyclase